MRVAGNAEQDTERRGYSAVQVSNFDEQLRKLRNEAMRFKFDLGHLAEQLTVTRAKTFAQQGLGRRFHLIERCVLNIFEIYPAGRQKFLSTDECTDIAIQFHAFAMNVYALFDNVAWVCLLEAGHVLPPMKIGLLKKACQPFIPLNLAAFLAQPDITRWFHDYGTLYRDSTVHRIAPYLPSRSYTPEEGERLQQLHDRSMQEWSAPAHDSQRTGSSERLERLDRLEREKAELGRNSLFMCLSLTGEDASPPVHLHPQLLCDWGLAQEIIRHFLDGMRQSRGWLAPDIPPLEIVD
jgi:hypothetical protein